MKEETKKDLTFSEYQDRALATAQYPNIGENLYYPSLGLAGEVGEICEKVKKLMRDFDGVMSEDRRVSLLKELGDVSWYLNALAFELGSTLEEVALMNLEKLEDRNNRGVIKGSGDNR